MFIYIKSEILILETYFKINQFFNGLSMFIEFRCSYYSQQNEEKTKIYM